MKKIIISILIILLVAIIVILVNISNNNIKLNDVSKFNEQFETFKDKTLYGADILTIINKAIDNNDVHDIAKKENGEYIDDRNLCSKS